MKKSMKERQHKEWHESQRGYFAGALFDEMAKDERISVITADLGYGMFDKIKEEYPNRFYNIGAAENTAIGVAVGMTYSGKIPIVYSITPFLLYRPFEMLRNYVSHEEAPVKLVGSGRDFDYEHDGFTHHAQDAMQVLNALPNIVQFWPSDKEDVIKWMEDFLYNKKPSFMSLRR